jgi:ribosomal protein S18 acetylase RimI-like enzyme
MRSQSFLPRQVETLYSKAKTTFIRKMVLFARELSPPPSMPTLSVEVAIRLLDGAEFRQCTDGLRKSLSQRSFVERVERGNVCFALSVEGRIVHTAWVALRRGPIEYLRRDLALGEDEIFIFDSYTHPEYRSLHLATARAAFVAEFYAAKGFRRSLGVVAVENTAGLAVPEAVGYRRIGLYGAFCIGRLCRTWSEPLPGQRIPPLISMR